MVIICNADSLTQSGNGSSYLGAASESATASGSVDVSAVSQQDSVTELARQVCDLLTVFLKEHLPSLENGRCDFKSDFPVLIFTDVSGHC